MLCLMSNRRSVVPAGLVLVSLPLASPALAAESAGCASINRGTVNSVLEAGQQRSPFLTLSAGETVTFQVAGSALGSASIDLTSGQGAPRSLLAGTNAGSTTFVVPADGAYGLKIAASGAAVASVRATCITGGTTQSAFSGWRDQMLRSVEPDRARMNPSEPGLLTQKDGTKMPAVLDVDENGQPRNASFSVSLSEITKTVDKSKANDKPGILDFWVEGRYASAHIEPLASAPNEEATFGALYFGSTVKLTPDIMIGALTQFDKAEVRGDPSEAFSSHGWMAGPFFGVRFKNGIVWEGRTAWGESTLPSGEGTGAVRGLVSTRVSGERMLGDWKFTPSVGVKIFDEIADHAPAEGTPATGTGVIDVVPVVSRRIALNRDTTIEPSFSAGTTLSFDGLHGAELNGTALESELRLKAGAGVALNVKDGATLKATGGVESPVDSAPDVWSGQLQLNVPLNK